MNNVVLDIGNTRIKVAIFTQTELQELRFFEQGGYLACQEYLATVNATWCILSTTQQDESDFISFLKHHFQLIELNAQTPIPIKIDYETPETLGDDRKAAVCGAIAEFGYKPMLVITAGTCVTYNYFDGKSFLGGSISPGLQMRYQAMHEFTGLLPLVKDSAFDGLIGYTTEQSLLSGVRQGILAEVEGMITKYQLLHKNLSVFLCGGDTFFFESRLKSKIFASPNLVLLGLNHILQYNKTS